MGGTHSQTSAQGYYQIAGLAPGEYAVAAFKTGWQIAEPSQEVTLPPDALDIDFMGYQLGLDLVNLVSRNSSGIQGDGDSILLGMSADGRYALFHSCSNNFVLGMFPDLNCDVLRHDTQTGETISLASLPYTTSQGVSGFIGVASSPRGGMSDDGRIVVFVSGEEMVVPGDNNSVTDVFIRDVVTGTLNRITLPSGTEIAGGAHSPTISADGNYIVFKSSSSDIDTNPRWDEDLYLFERATGEITRITKRQTSGGEEFIGRAVISEDGRYIVFDSLDASFVPGPHIPVDYLSRVYLYDRIDETYLMIGPADSINGASDITPNGRYVLVTSGADLIPDVPYAYSEQVYLFDVELETFTLVSFNSDGQPGNDISTGGVISDDGRFVVFGSVSTDLVTGTYLRYDERLYVADLEAQTVDLIDLGLLGEDTNGSTFIRAISPDARYIGFTSDASNLMVGDVNGASDAFLYELNPSADGDDDGQTSETENAAPNNGDGNNDGIPDSQQANVTSLPNSSNGEYLTLATPNGTELADVAAIDNPAPGTEPEGAEFPAGFIEFGINGLANGAATTVEIFLEGGVTAETYYKYGPTSNNPADHWYEFLYDGTTGAEILVDKIVLHFVDGERGDGDLTANGTITDPGAPAILTSATSSVYLSPTAKLTLNGVTYADEDILTYDEATGAWSLFFDGSDVGLAKAKVSAFELLDDGSILLSLSKPMKNLPGLTNVTVDDSDILRFTPTTIGETTAGTFAVWFDGSDVELTKGGERIDAIAFTPGGDLVISTTGAANVTGPSGALKAADEDLLLFNDTSLDDVTAGTWELYFDTGDVLTKLGDVVAAGIDPTTGDILFAPDKKWVFGALTVNTYDIGRCKNPTTGANSACGEVDRFWEGALHGFSNKKYKIDGFSMGK